MMLTQTGPREWEAVRISSHFIIAEIVGISDLRFCGPLEFLQPKRVSDPEQPIGKRHEHTA